MVLEVSKMKFKSFEDVQRWEGESKEIIEKGEGSCKSCGCSFEDATEKRGGVCHNPDMKNEEWVCHQCDDPEAFEFEKKVKELLNKNGYHLKCPDCGEKMGILFSYVCECGNER